MPRWVYAIVGVLGVVMVAVAAVVWSSKTESSPPPVPYLADFGTAASVPTARGLSLKPGPGRQIVENSCTTCHSLAPIIRHDGFSKSVWREEVQKMIKRYGAPIDDQVARQITAYLQRYYSSSPAPGSGTLTAPGTG